VAKGHDEPEARLGNDRVSGLAAEPSTRTDSEQSNLLSM
jgi:hypothetical protein